MEVEVRLFANLADYGPPGAPGGAARVELPDGATVGDLLRRLRIPDEVPAILQRGERVLSRAEAAGYGQGGRSAPIVLNFSVQTPDAASFRRAQSQITADIAAALRRAERNL